MKTRTQKHLAVQYMARGHRALMGQCLLLISLLASAAVSASNLTDVEFNALEGGRFEARFQFDGAAPEVKGYTIEKPARIALDLIGAKNQLDQKKFPLAYDNASSAIVLEGRDRTRVVLNLVSLAPYETRVEGNELVVAVGGGGSKAYLKEKYNNPVLSMAEAAPEASGNRITDLDFRRGDAAIASLTWIFAAAMPVKAVWSLSWLTTRRTLMSLSKGRESKLILVVLHSRRAFSDVSTWLISPRRLN